MYNLGKTTDCDVWLKHVSDIAGCAGPWQQVALLQFTLPVYMSAWIPGLQMCSSRCPAHCVSDGLSANLHCHASLETVNPAVRTLLAAIFLGFLLCPQSICKASQAANVAILVHQTSAVDTGSHIAVCSG